MKHLLLLLTIITLGLWRSSAQLVVNDPTATQVATIGWSKSLSEAVAQSKILMDSKALLTQSLDIFTKVSSTIQNVHAVKNVIDRQVKMVSILNKELSRKDIANLESYTRHINRMQGIILEAQGTITMLNSVLNPAIQMSQGERLKLIVELDKQSKEQYDLMQAKLSLFNQLNDARRKFEKLAK